MEKNPEVESFFSNAERWGREARVLRGYLLDCGLSEERKWRKPCYVDEGKNICIVQSFKAFLALLFFKGALLEDPEGVLEPQGPNSRVGYRMRFTSVGEVEALEASIKAYVNEAILIEKSGLKVETRPAGEVELPGELMEAFAEDPEFAAAFDLLSPGRQRGYAWHFADAKRSQTRAARVARHRPWILAGKGLRDR